MAPEYRPDERVEVDTMRLLPASAVLSSLLVPAIAAAAPPTAVRIGGVEYACERTKSCASSPSRYSIGTAYTDGTLAGTRALARSLASGLSPRGIDASNLYFADPSGALVSLDISTPQKAESSPLVNVVPHAFTSAITFASSEPFSLFAGVNAGTVEIFRKDPVGAPSLLFSGPTTDRYFVGQFLRLSPTAASPRWLIHSRSSSLYATDGTAAGTRQLAAGPIECGTTVLPGERDVIGCSTTGMSIVDGTTTRLVGAGLYMSDGLTLTKVSDAPGAGIMGVDRTGGAYIYGADVNYVLSYRAADGTVRVLASDGADVSPGIVRDGRLFFVRARTGPWVSDGTNAGTKPDPALGASRLTGTLGYQIVGFSGGKRIWLVSNETATEVVASDDAGAKVVGQLATRGFGISRRVGGGFAWTGTKLYALSERGPELVVDTVAVPGRSLDLIDDTWNRAAVFRLPNGEVLVSDGMASGSGVVGYTDDFSQQAFWRTDSHVYFRAYSPGGGGTFAIALPLAPRESGSPAPGRPDAGVDGGAPGRDDAGADDGGTERGGPGGGEEPTTTSSGCSATTSVPGGLAYAFGIVMAAFAARRQRRAAREGQERS